MSKTQISTGGITDATIATADLADDAVTAAKIADAVTFGKIGQIVQDTKTDTFSTSSGANSPAALTGLSVAITPSATSSKILVMVNIGFVSQSGANHGSFFLQRGGSNIFVGDAASNRPRATFGYGDHYNDWVGSPVSCCYLDSPSSTSEQTYSVAVGGNGSATMYINRSHRDNDGTAEDGRQASTITVMEVLA